MPVKKGAAKTKTTAAAGKKPGDRKKAGKTGEPLRDAWNSAMEALQGAQQEAEKQIRTFMKKNKISGKDASKAIDDLGKRVDRQRRKAVKEFERELASVQTHLKKERKAISKTIDDAVKGALAAFNIPSRQEVGRLTKKVDELSKKIDAFSPRPKKRPAPRKRAAAKPKPATSTDR